VSKAADLYQGELLTSLDHECPVPPPALFDAYIEAADSGIGVPLVRATIHAMPSRIPARAGCDPSVKTRIAYDVMLCRARARKKQVRLAPVTNLRHAALEELGLDRLTKL